MVEFLKRHKSHLAALLFSILIWFLVVTENYFESVIKVPIDITNLKSDTIVSSTIPKSAKVRFGARGRSLLRLLLFNEAKVVLDLKREIGKRIITLVSSDVVLRGASSDIDVVELVSPDTVSVTVESLVRKRVQIESQIKIKTFPGYTIAGSIKLSPDSVLLEGPKSLINNFEIVQTKPRIFMNVKHPLKEEVSLVLPDNPKVKFLSSKTIIYADIQKLMEKLLDGIPVEIKSIPRGMKAIVIPSHLALTIEGGVEVLTKVSRDNIVAYVDLKKEWTSSEKGHLAYIETPAGVRYRDVVPKYFKVVLEKDQ